MRELRIPLDAFDRPEMMPYLAAGAGPGDTIFVEGARTIVVRELGPLAAARVRKALDAHDSREGGRTAPNTCKARRRRPAPERAGLRVLKGGA